MTEDGGECWYCGSAEVESVDSDYLADKHLLIQECLECNEQYTMEYILDNVTRN